MVYARFTISRILQPLANVLDDLLSSRLASHIRRQQSTLLKVRIHRLVDLSRSLLLTLELQHQRRRPDRRNRVRDSPTLDIRCRSMARLANDKVLTNVGGGDQTKGSNERRSAVRQDVSVKVRRNDDIVITRLTKQLINHRIHNLLLNLQHLILLIPQHPPRHLPKQPIRLTQHITLMRNRHHPPPVNRRQPRVPHALPAERNVARHGRNVGRRVFRNALDGFGDAGAVGRGVGFLLLDVEVFGVLADDDEVYGAGSGACGFHGADVGVEVEAFAEGDDGGGVAFYFCGGGTMGVLVFRVLQGGVRDVGRAGGEL